jgi:hypothetical protein
MRYSPVKTILGEALLQRMKWHPDILPAEADAGDLAAPRQFVTESAWDGKHRGHLGHGQQPILDYLCLAVACGDQDARQKECLYARELGDKSRGGCWWHVCHSLGMRGDFVQRWDRNHQEASLVYVFVSIFLSWKRWHGAELKHWLRIYGHDSILTQVLPRGVT